MSPIVVPKILFYDCSIYMQVHTIKDFLLYNILYSILKMDLRSTE